MTHNDCDGGDCVPCSREATEAHAYTQGRERNTCAVCGWHPGHELHVAVPALSPENNAILSLFYEDPHYTYQIGDLLEGLEDDEAPWFTETPNEDLEAVIAAEMVEKVVMVGYRPTVDLGNYDLLRLLHREHPAAETEIINGIYDIVKHPTYDPEDQSAAYDLLVTWIERGMIRVVKTWGVRLTAKGLQSMRAEEEETELEPEDGSRVL